MQTFQTVILAAGQPDLRNRTSGLFTSIEMVPVNGKPVIGWIIDEELKRGDSKIIHIVARQTDTALSKFIKDSYDHRALIVIHLTPKSAPSDSSILDSLNIAAMELDPLLPTKVILGDTLILDELPKMDHLVASRNIEDSKPWCLVDIDEAGFIRTFYDKVSVPLENKFALAGYYTFESTPDLITSLDKALSAAATQLSEVLRYYHSKRPLKISRSGKWFDFGHVDRIVKAKYELLDSRFFNSLKVDSRIGTIEKRSSNKAKLKDEANWFETLPNELKILTPRLLEHWETDSAYHVKQELYGYPTLAELFLFSDMGPGSWRSTLQKVLNIHGLLASYRGELARTEIAEIYRTKTWQRIDSLTDLGAGWNDLLGIQSLVINGEVCYGLAALRKKLNARMDHIIDTAQASIIHGDYCFSNILFDPGSQIVRLIDPRGRWGKQTILGDPRYDIAKLRHSVSGRYDFVNANLFKVELVKPREFHYSIFSRSTHLEVAQIFDELLQASGYNLDEIRLIEATLFLSMIPLHSDHPDKQKLFFLHGLKLLNSTLKENDVS